ncbi:tRNA 2-thiouridine synthesizing protein B [Bisgaardia hudsonensis]|uniref:tRNA 2-thiouridine synthesizing protein B n=1 Tax=Bisgaardia hudsonensis TaxID=109472 RepID=A0A4R2MZU6_9PAST|nr:DsrH/TusB family sulfur metabolism protein [Bisgaardia hudsonensis]QLB12144.1 hypothetical protein A6A11_00210 [Bisgaardia hudsonensis]TCP11503.1 tRNA 2-thiouridine synthesizing protein B [Bisgaardia hudsonensis]
MLYTFSQANYSEKELIHLFKEIKSDDYILFWQDGVLFPIKYQSFLLSLNCNIGIFKNDVDARNLRYSKDLYSNKLKLVALDDIVDITINYFPQICL